MSDSMGRVDGPGTTQGKSASRTMADTPSVVAERRRIDALTSAAIGFFLLAVGFTAWVALRSSPVFLATLMLLAGLAGIACLGLFVLRGSAEPASDPELAPERLLEALDEAAAVAAADGRISVMNRAWRESV